MQYFINDRYEVEVEGGKSASLRALFAAADMDDVWYAASKCAEGHGTRRCRAAMQGMQGWWQVTFRQVTPSSRRMTCEVSLLAWQRPASRPRREGRKGWRRQMREFFAAGRIVAKHFPATAGAAG